MVAKYPLSIVFFGTGPISLATLAEISQKFVVEAVITKADSTSPGGKTIQSPVKSWAEEHGLPIFQPQSKSELAKLFREQSFASTVGLVVDYGIIIPASVIAAFSQGVVNSHFALLPRWRGADPITAALISGATHTGVSLMTIDEGLDTGKLIAQEALTVPNNCTVDELEKSLVELSNKLIHSTLVPYVSGRIKAWEQDKSVTPTYTKKLFKKDGLVDWQRPAVELERQIRAYLNWPGSFTTIAGKPIILTKVHVEALSGQPGAPFLHEGNQLGVFCGQDALIIERLKPAGKREMTGQEFLAGNPI